MSESKRTEPTKNPKITFGNVDLEPDEFAPEHTKVRLSMWIDGDLLQAIKARARSQREPKYQTWLNKFLRAMVLGEGLENATPRELSGAIEILCKRLDALERAQKKRA